MSADYGMKFLRTRGEVRLVLRGALTLLVALLPVRVCAFDLITTKSTPYVITLTPGTVPMRLKLPVPAGPLSDGSSSYNASVQSAMQIWNGLVGMVQFSAEIMLAGGNTVGNDLNEVVIADKVGGDDFDPSTLAVTVSFVEGDKRVESDIVFNAAKSFVSYRGPLRANTYDIQRIAVHELGHVLGLSHPDEAGQTVTAIMNSRIGNIEVPQSDDLDGARTLYGAPASVPVNDSFASSTVIQLNSATYTTTGTNIQASKETGEPSHAADIGGRSVWWRWTAPANGRITFTTLGSNFDTLLAAYTGTGLASLTPLASNDDAETPEQNPAPSRLRTSTITFDAVAGTTYRIAVDGWDGLFGQITLNLQFAAESGSPPVITAQPVSRTVSAGGSASFSVTAAGGILSYQWYFNGAALSGATGADLTVSSAQSANAGAYHVVVSNFYGTVTSSTVQLTVNPVVTPPSGGGGGGGGGGGAPSGWFIATLALLCAVRRLRRNG